MIRVLMHDLETTLDGELSEVKQLGFGMLVNRGNSDI